MQRLLEDTDYLIRLHGAAEGARAIRSAPRDGNRGSGDEDVYDVKYQDGDTRKAPEGGAAAPRLVQPLLLRPALALAAAPRNRRQRWYRQRCWWCAEKERLRRCGGGGGSGGGRFGV